jgi:hypothetical protein
MNMRRLYTLVVVWFFLLTGPAMLVMLGVFGHFDTHTNLSGGLIAAWLLGYLAQFGVFMWIMSTIDQQSVLWRTLVWWFSASLLPWALDWTPASPLFVLWYAIAVGLACWIPLAARSDQSFEQHGIRATGVVLEVLKPSMNVVINNVYIKRKVRLRIEREDGVPAYEGVLNGLFMLGEIPSPGDRIPLLVDPKQPQRVEYNKNAGAKSSAPNRPAAPAATSHGNIADELDKLAQLRDRGALTASEFDAAKKKLLRD